VNPNSGFADTWTRNAVRTALVIGTSIVAVCVPYFGGVLVTVGGITDAFQIYVVPSLIYLKMQQDKNIKDRYTYIYYFVFVWGVCLMTFTIYNTISAVL
jgi:amino acid permease